MRVGDVLPFLAMVIVQVGYAGMNTTSKLAIDSGMKPLVFVTYRQIFATFAMIPFAYFFEWRTSPKITLQILFQIFLCSLTGITGNQVFFFLGLQYTGVTVSTALANILPAATFILAVLFRQESVGMKQISGQAKALGTMLCVGGAMLLTFYHGPNINIGESSIHWKYAGENSRSSSNDANKSNPVLGPMLAIASTFSWAIWYIVQVKVSKMFPAPYTSTLLMCLMGSIQCAVIGISTNHKLSLWSLHSSFRLMAILYAAIVGSALAFSLTSWAIQRKGAVYASIFSPLTLVVVAILGWALVHEKIYVGTIVGSVLIIPGLYAVLWGKSKEMKFSIEEEETEARKIGEKEDLELQLPATKSIEK